jgi:hypothetical protein
MDITANIETDPAVLAYIRSVPEHPIPPGQAVSQEISFVYGNLSRKSSLTREAVTAIITGLRGNSA